MRTGRLGGGWSLHGTAVVCCIHGVAKEQRQQVIYDVAREKPAECVCCHNVFTYDFNRMDVPLLCPDCNKGG